MIWWRRAKEELEGAERCLLQNWHEVGRLDLEKGGRGEDPQLAYRHPSTSDRVLQLRKESDGIILKDIELLI